MHGCPQLLTANLQNVCINKDYQAGSPVHTCILVQTIRTFCCNFSLSPATDHNHIYLLLQSALHNKTGYLQNEPYIMQMLFESY